MKSSNKFWLEKWKKFKEDFNITSTTALGKDFLSFKKLVRNKNRDTIKIALLAKAVLELFLKS